MLEVKPPGMELVCPRKVAWSWRLPLKKLTELIDTYIKQSLPDAKYKDLCLKLNSSSSKWLSNLVTYLNGEIKRVQKYGIPEQKTYTLVLDQLHTMYEEMWSSCWLM